jgi:hypothetical protein
MTKPTQPLDLDAIEARLAAATQDPWVQARPEDGRALLAEVRRLRARVTELEGPAVQARAALAALCYDLEDPGTAALGALYLISRATVGVEAPKDDAAIALARHDSEVLGQAADAVEQPIADGEHDPDCLVDELRRRAAVPAAAPSV